MMNMIKAATCVGFLACSPSLATDLFRCDYPDGRIVYQGAQCEIGVKQTSIDSENAKREQIRKSLEQERQKRLEKSTAVKTAG